MSLWFILEVAAIAAMLGAWVGVALAALVACYWGVRRWWRERAAGER